MKLSVPEEPEVRTVDDPRAKLRREAFEAGLGAQGSDWWAELAPLRPAERVLVKKAIEGDRELKNQERSKAARL